MAELSEDERRKLSGVSGWLGVFVASMLLVMILVIISSVQTFQAGWTRTAAANFAFVPAFGYGLVLTGRRDQRTRRYWLVLLFAAIVWCLWYGFTFGFAVELDMELAARLELGVGQFGVPGSGGIARAFSQVVTPELLQSSLVASIADQVAWVLQYVAWFLYWRSSKRVLVTFGPR